MRNLVLAYALMLAGPAVADPGTAFTYQGQLKNAAGPIEGTVSLQFSLFDAEKDGVQIGATVTPPDRSIKNGLVQETLDFGEVAFAGEARWLEIALDADGGADSFVTLEPRVEILPVPYAMYSETARTVLVDAVDDADADPTNELQGLASVLAQGSNAGDQSILGLSGIFASGDGPVSVGNAVDGGNFTSDEFQQTFRVSTPSLLTRISFTGNAPPGPGMLSVFEGTGTGGTLLAEESLPDDGQLVAVVDFASSPLLVPGEVYTFSVTTPGAVGLRVSPPTNPFPDGQLIFPVFSTSDQRELVFTVDVEQPGVVLAGAFVGDGSRLTGVPDGHSLDASDGSPADALSVDAEGRVTSLGTLNLPAVGLSFGGVVRTEMVGTVLELQSQPPVLDQEYIGSGLASFTGNASSWQSFTASTAADPEYLVVVDVVRNNGTGSATVNVYEGQGTTGALLGTARVGPTHVPLDEQTAVFSPPIAVTDGSVYTIEVVGGPPGAGMPAGWLFRSGDPYPGGRASSGGGDYDHLFRTYNIASLDDAEYVDAVAFDSLNQRVGIKTTSPGFDLHVNGTAGKPGGGSWATASDGRLKDVGSAFTRGLDALEGISPVFYHYRSGNALNLPSAPGHVGLVAQDVQAAIPEAIADTGSSYLHVDNDPIIWTMLNAIKELRTQKDAEIDALKERNAELEARVERLERLVLEVQREE